MNKNILSLFISICLVMSAFSQATINPQVGVNITSLDYNVSLTGNVTAEAGTGYQIGFVVRTGGSFFVEPGFFLMGTNQKYVVTDGNTTAISGTVGNTSLQLPVRVGIITGGGEGVFNVRVAAGPVIGYNLDASDNPFDLSQADFNDLTYGAKAGLGFDIFIATLDIDYQVGLNDVFKEGSNFSISTLGEQGRNNTLLITAGIKF